jgi:hypothetical protein
MLVPKASKEVKRRAFLAKVMRPNKKLALIS